MGVPLVAEQSLGRAGMPTTPLSIQVKLVRMGPSKPTPSAIRSLMLDGPAGQLEALLNSGAENATHAALVCHPHPLFGGTMHNKVVFHAMKALNSFGFPVLRFNFRGSGLSHGEHDHGRGEIDDVRDSKLQREAQRSHCEDGSID